MTTLADSTPAVRPPLKWAGGKRWQVPHLRPLWAPHSHRRLVEPFCGGLAVALGLLPDRALLNDANPHLINFYRWIQQGLRITLPMENHERQFYRHRVRFNKLVSAEHSETEEAAALFYYLNRTGYNGLCRFNSRGGFNVPFGRHRSISYARSFPAMEQVLSQWSLASSDFSELAVERRDFIYADPPYDVTFTTYAPAGFTWADQVRVAKWCAGHPGPVVLVNASTARVRHLYLRLGFHLSTVQSPRRISCTGDRTPAQEVVATRNL